MEQLIGILLKNWYLVIIAFAFFYQIRSKSRRANQGNQTRPGMPSFGDAPNGATRPVEAKKSRPEGVWIDLAIGTRARRVWSF